MAGERQFLDQALLDSLDWHQAGLLSSADSPFGLIVKGPADQYWIVLDGLLWRLKEDLDVCQFLLVKSDQLHIGFSPRKLKVPLKDRFDVFKKTICELLGKS